MMLQSIEEVVSNARYDTYRITFYGPMIAMTTEEAEKAISNAPKIYAATSLGLTFTDRTSYLGWRIAWKRRYKEISTNIKKARHHLKSPFGLSWAERAICQHNVAHMSGVATMLLLLLEEGKMEAAQQMGKPRARRYHHCRVPKETLVSPSDGA